MVDDVCFFENLILGRTNQLRNRETHIRYQNDTANQASDTVNDTVLSLIWTNTAITAEEIRYKLNISMGGNVEAC